MARKIDFGENVLNSTSGNRCRALIMSLLALDSRFGSLVSLYNTLPEREGRMSTSAQYGATNSRLPSRGNDRGVYVLTPVVNEMIPFVFTYNCGKDTGWVYSEATRTYELRYKYLVSKNGSLPQTVVHILQSI